MSAWFRALFLFSSFGPLYAALGLGLAVQKQTVPAVVAAVAAALAVLVFLHLRAGFRDSAPFRDNVEVIAQLDENILSYLIAYIPPLLIDDYRSAAKDVSALAFYTLVAVLMSVTDTLYVNPFFLIWRYRIFRVKLMSGRTVVLITQRREVVSGDDLNLYELQRGSVYFAE